MNVLNYISEGSQNGITGKRLAELCNCDTRQITAQISQLRRKGYVILSNTTNGYFLPANKEEIRHFVLSMRSRIKKIKMATISAEQSLCENDAQIEFEV